MKDQYIGIILYYIVHNIRFLNMQQNEAVVTLCQVCRLMVLYIQVNVMLVLSSWPILHQIR